MTDAGKLNMLAAMTGETNQAVLSAYLYLAGQKVLARAFPYDPSVTAVPGRYDAAHIEIAAYLINKRGAEGETAHSENGVSRSYEDGDVPSSLLRGIVPFAALAGSREAEE